MRLRGRLPNYLKTEDITDFRDTADWLIYKDGLNIIAKKGSTGENKCVSTDAATVIQYCLDNNYTGGNGVRIQIGTGDYTITKTMTPQDDYAFEIFGAGRNLTHLKMANDTVADMFKCEPTDTIYFCSIRELHLDGNRSGGAIGNAINWKSTNGGEIRDFIMNDVIIDEFAGKAFYTDFTRSYYFHRMIIERCSSATGMVEIKGTTADPASPQTSFVSCRFANTLNGSAVRCWAPRTRFISCEFEYAAREGIEINGPHCKLIACVIRNNSKETANTYAGCQINAAGDYSVVVGCQFDGLSTEKYNIALAGGAASDMIIGNYLTGAATSPINDLGTGNIKRYSTGYITENGGAAATVADGGAINHGLATTPTFVTVSPSIASEMVSVITLDTTHFHVAIKKDTGAAGTTQTIYWRAWI
jgi:hypothetical protein